MVLFVLVFLLLLALTLDCDHPVVEGNLHIFLLDGRGSVRITYSWSVSLISADGDRSTLPPLASRRPRGQRARLLESRRLNAVQETPTWQVPQHYGWFWLSPRQR